MRKIKRNLFIVFLIVVTVILAFYIGQKEIYLQSSGGQGGTPSNPFPGFTSGGLNQCPPSKVYECKEMRSKSVAVETDFTGLDLSGASYAGLRELIDQYSNVKTELESWLSSKNCPNSVCKKSEFRYIGIEIWASGTSGTCTNPPPPLSEHFSVINWDDTNQQEATQGAQNQLSKGIAIWLDDNKQRCLSLGCTPYISVTNIDIQELGRVWRGGLNGWDWGTKASADAELTCAGGAPPKTGIRAAVVGKYCIGCSPTGSTTGSGGGGRGQQGTKSGAGGTTPGGGGPVGSTGGSGGATVGGGSGGTTSGGTTTVGNNGQVGVGD